MFIHTCVADDDANLLPEMVILSVREPIPYACAKEPRFSPQKSPVSLHKRALCLSNTKTSLSLSLCQLSVV